MSRERASGVQNLRAMFENQEAEAQRSSSPSGRSSVGEVERKGAKVRASFVSVDRPENLTRGTSDAASDAGKDSDHANGRLDSTTDNQQPTANASVQKSIEGEDKADIRSGSSFVAPKIGGGAVNASEDKANPSTAAAETVSSDEHKKGSERSPGHDAKVDDQPKETILPVAQPEKEIPAANPDKPVTAVEKEPGTLKPADPTSSASTATSLANPPKESKVLPAGGAVAKASDPPESNGDKAENKGTPGKKRTKQSKPSLNLKQGGTATSPTASEGQPLKSPGRPATSDSKDAEKSSEVSKSGPRGGRASLTAQTASSAAKTRSGAPDDAKSVGTDRSLPIRSKPRSPTRPAKLPSHLTAATAASAAKHENSKPAAKPSPAQKVSGSSSVRSSLGDSKPSSSSAKSGFGRSNSIATKPQARQGNAKSVVADGGFLARMMRPTASSASKMHDKPDGKTQDKDKVDAKPLPSKVAAATTKTVPKTKPAVAGNGHAKGPAADKPAVTPDNHDEVKDGHDGATPAPQDAPGPDETTIDSSSAGIGTPGVGSATIR